MQARKTFTVGRSTINAAAQFSEQDPTIGQGSQRWCKPITATRAETVAQMVQADREAEAAERHQQWQRERAADTARRSAADLALALRTLSGIRKN